MSYDLYFIKASKESKEYADFKHGLIKEINPEVESFCNKLEKDFSLIYEDKFDPFNDNPDLNPRLIWDPGSLNITSNLKPMFQKAFECDSSKGEQWFQIVGGKPLSDLLIVVNKAIQNIVANFNEYEKLNDPKGFGTVGDLLLFLHRVNGFIHKFRDNKIEAYLIINY